MFGCGAYSQPPPYTSSGSGSSANIHDSRLVAGMNVYGVERLLTFKTADFARFGISLLYPTSL
jgi:hypothetical protein